MSTPPPQGNGPIIEIAADVFYVTGSVTMAPLVRIPRNMVIIRHEGALTVINTVRLEDESELNKLGKVEHVVRIGSHGMDDAHYLKQFGAKYWAPKDMVLSEGLTADERITQDTELPFPDASVFLFEKTKKPEAAILLKRDDGLLITCDCVQHWVNTDGCSFLGRGATHMLGFIKPAQIGPPWRKAMTPAGGSLEPDFERLAALPFDQLIAGHGVLLESGARDRLKETMVRVFG
ncbi:MAG: hypothetical protein ACI9KE_001076 [Polyangiales bacterium]|jgi:hypothetical protein